MSLSTRLIEDSSFELLCNAKTPEGEAFARAVHVHSKAIAAEYLRTQYAYFRTNMVGVIAIPRGGVPTAKAVQNCLADEETGDILYVESRLKKEADPKEILGPNLRAIRPEVAFIIDGVIASGQSISKHFTAIADAEPKAVIVLSNCTTEVGMAHLTEQAKVHGFRNFEQVTGRIFGKEECQWVDKDGEQVLFVGYNEEGGVNYQLPDFGDAIQPLRP